MRAATGKFARVFVFVLAAWLTLLSIAHPLCAQTTVSTGGIVGTVSDPSGAVVSGACHDDGFSSLLGPHFGPPIPA
jgi:hypothetical protein